MGRGCPTKINVSSSWSRARLGEELEIRGKASMGKKAGQRDRGARDRDRNMEIQGHGAWAERGRDMKAVRQRSPEMERGQRERERPRDGERGRLSVRVRMRERERVSGGRETREAADRLTEKAPRLELLYLPP